jgi:hypothetical protein
VFVGGKGFNLFGISREVIEQIGYFDENIYPAFWEDRDYLHRLQLWEGALIRTFGDIRPIHGLFVDSTGGEIDQITTDCMLKNIGQSDPVDCGHAARDSVKYISGTKYIGDRGLRRLLLAAGDMNFKYVIDKWGCDISISKQRYNLMNCVYKTPFNSGNILSHWIKNETKLLLLRDI